MLLEAPDCDVVLVDGRHDLAAVRSLCRLIRTTGVAVPVILVVTEGGLAVVAADWGIDDVLLSTAGPAEVEARLRLGMGRLALAVPTATTSRRSSRAATWRSTRRLTPRSSTVARST